MVLFSTLMEQWEDQVVGTGRQERQWKVNSQRGLGPDHAGLWVTTKTWVFTLNEVGSMCEHKDIGMLSHHFLKN